MDPTTLLSTPAVLASPPLPEVINTYGNSSNLPPKKIPSKTSLERPIKWGYNGVKAKWKSLALHLPEKNSESKPILHPWRVSRNNGTITESSSRMQWWQLLARIYWTFLFDLCRWYVDLGEWWVITINLVKWWLQLQLLYQMHLSYLMNKPIWCSPYSAFNVANAFLIHTCPQAYLPEAVSFG